MSSVNNHVTTVDLNSKFDVLCPLGEGATSEVFLVRSKESGEQFALKVFSKRADYYRAESRTYKDLSRKSKHIIGSSQHFPMARVHVPVGTESELHLLAPALIMEFAPHGDLFDVIMNHGALPEKLTRHYFHQLITSLDVMHKAGYVNRDVKLDNLFLDADFNLKMGDLGFAKKMEYASDGRVRSMTECLGTQKYKAPELILKKEYNGESVDIFAAGVTLFIMFTGAPPFEMAERQDAHYSYISAGSWEKFWYLHNYYRRKEDHFTAEFKSLMKGMLAANPAERFTISQVQSHPWFKGALPTTGDIKFEMRNRCASAQNFN